MIWPDMKWYDMIWFGMVWYDTIQHRKYNYIYMTWNTIGADRTIEKKGKNLPGKLGGKKGKYCIVFFCCCNSFFLHVYMDIYVYIFKTMSAVIAFVNFQIYFIISARFLPHFFWRICLFHRSTIGFKQTNFQPTSTFYKWLLASVQPISAFSIGLQQLFNIFQNLSWCSSVFPNYFIIWAFISLSSFLEQFQKESSIQTCTSGPHMTGYPFWMNWWPLISYFSIFIPYNNLFPEISKMVVQYHQSIKKSIHTLVDQVFQN